MKMCQCIFNSWIEYLSNNTAGGQKTEIKRPPFVMISVISDDNHAAREAKKTYNKDLAFKTGKHFEIKYLKEDCWCKISLKIY